MTNKINKNLWISASAGSGKTKALIDRFLALVLSGVDPKKILCVTFTRSAAAEMMSRITDELSAWAISEKEILCHRLSELLGRTPSVEEIKFAQICFANFLNFQANLHIETIHSFCQSVLNKFPFESRIVGNYKVIDEPQKQVLINKAKLLLMQDEALLQDSSIQNFLEDINDLKFNEILGKILFINSMDHAVFESISVIESYIEKLRQSLEAPPTEENLVEKYLKQLRDKTNQQRVHLEAARDADVDFAKNWLVAVVEEQFYNLIFTKGGTPRQKVLNKRQKEEFPQLYAFIAEAQEIQIGYARACDAREIIEQTNGFLKVGYHFLRHYNQVKSLAGYLDYDDLITRCLNLLEDETSFQWIRRYLNDKFSHVMVDEAQDVNLNQWRLIRVLFEEFCHNFYMDSSKTLFVVGDLKQSIYSFQGTSPYLFVGMEQSIKNFAGQFNIPIYTARFSQSFRSDPTILQFVDKVFEIIRSKNSAYFFEKTQHVATKIFKNSAIELWPAVLGQSDLNEEEEEITGWKLPAAQLDIEEVCFKVLSNKLAIKIKDWIDRGDYNPRDIMILVRKRDEFMEHMIRELKLLNVPISGMDRIVLNQNIAVEDLISLVKFILYPYDDYNLACLLKSPIFAVVEEELFELCQRGDETLWNRMQAYHSPYCSLLKTLLEDTKLHLPHALFSHVLDVLKMRTKFISRFGFYINQILDEFLEACLTFEIEQSTSLTLFLRWFETGAFEIKQNFSHNVEEIRIMTIHAAKGLESKVVILPDTLSVPKKNADRVLFDPYTSEILYGSSNKLEFCNELSKRIDLQMLQEYYRILYVALTRASERLLICGWSNRKTIPTNSWYALMEEAVEQLKDISHYEQKLFQTDSINSI